MINSFRSDRRTLKIWYAHYYFRSVTVIIVIHFSLINIIGLLLLPLLPLHQAPLLNISNSFGYAPLISLMKSYVAAVTNNGKYVQTFILRYWIYVNIFRIF